MDKAEVEKRLNTGRQHMIFVIQLYKRQLDLGLHFLHEHPETANSWDLLQMIALRRRRRTHVTTIDQCMYGLVTPNSDGSAMVPTKKPTRFITSSAQMASQISTR